MTGKDTAAFKKSVNASNVRGRGHIEANKSKTLDKREKLALKRKN